MFGSNSTPQKTSDVCKSEQASAKPQNNPPIQSSPGYIIQPPSILPPGQYAYNATNFMQPPNAFLGNASPVNLGAHVPYVPSPMVPYNMYHQSLVNAANPPAPAQFYPNMYLPQDLSSSQSFNFYGATPPHINVMAQAHPFFSSSQAPAPGSITTPNLANQPAAHLPSEGLSMSYHANDVAPQPKKRQKAQQGQSMISSPPNTSHTPQSSVTPTSLPSPSVPPKASKVSDLPDLSKFSKNELDQLLECLQEPSSRQGIEPSITSLQEPSSSTTTTTSSSSAGSHKSNSEPKKSTLDKFSDYLDAFLKDSSLGKVRTDIYVKDKYLIINPKDWTPIVGKIQKGAIRAMITERLNTIQKACKARSNKPHPIKVEVFGKNGLRISGFPSLTCEQMCGALSTFLKFKLTRSATPEKRHKELSSFEEENPLFFAKSAVDDSLPPDESECVLSSPTNLSPPKSPPLEVPGPSLLPSSSALLQEPGFSTEERYSSFGRTSPTLFREAAGSIAKLPMPDGDAQNQRQHSHKRKQ